MRTSLIWQSILFIAIALSACAEPSKKINIDIPSTMESKIEEALEEKYQEAFIVHEAIESDEQNGVIFEASPKEFKECRFRGIYADGIREDSYPNNYYSSFLTKKMHEYISQYSNRYAFQADITADYEHVSGNHIPSLDDLLSKSSEGHLIHCYLYLFDVPSSADDILLSQTHAVAEKIASYTNGKFGLWTGFWPKGFLEDLKWEDTSFGFMSGDMEDTDNIMNKSQYLQKVISFDLKTKSIDEVSKADLFSIMGDYNFNKGYENKVF